MTRALRAALAANGFQDHHEPKTLSLSVKVFGVADQNTLTAAFRQDVLRISLALGPLLFALPADAETRLALITTNAAYPSETGPLANPHRDGEVIAEQHRNRQGH